MRWRQQVNKDGSSTFVPMDDKAVELDRLQGKNLNIIKGNFEAFKSMVDGRLIATQRDYDRHNKENNVVNAAEFDDAHYEKAAKKRADFYQGNRTRDEIFKARQAIYNDWVEIERHGD